MELLSWGWPGSAAQRSALRGLTSASKAGDAPVPIPAPSAPLPCAGCPSGKLCRVSQDSGEAGRVVRGYNDDSSSGTRPRSPCLEQTPAPEGAGHKGHSPPRNSEPGKPKTRVKGDTRFKQEQEELLSPCPPELRPILGSSRAPHEPRVSPPLAPCYCHPQSDCKAAPQPHGASFGAVPPALCLTRGQALPWAWRLAWD